MEELIQATQGSGHDKTQGHQTNQTWLPKGNKEADLVTREERRAGHQRQMNALTE